MKQDMAIREELLYGITIWLKNKALLKIEEI
jgi:hypothetical protein